MTNISSNLNCDDAVLMKFTCFRYLALFSYMQYCVFKKIKKGEFTVEKYLSCTSDFCFHEGIGIGIYFMASAMMDNVVIWASRQFGLIEEKQCIYVTQIAVYTMALISFIPNVIISGLFQQKYYYDGNKKSKALFIIVMVLTTIVCFCVRVMVIRVLGWINIVATLLHNGTPGVNIVIGSLTPPIVDVIQARFLTIYKSTNDIPLLDDKHYYHLTA